MLTVFLCHAACMRKVAVTARALLIKEACMHCRFNTNTMRGMTHMHTHAPHMPRVAQTECTPKATQRHLGRAPEVAAHFCHHALLERLAAVAGQVLEDLRAAQVAGHDDDRVLERHRVTLAVSHAPVVQDLTRHMSEKQGVRGRATMRE